MPFFLNKEIINDGVGQQKERDFQNVAINALANSPHDAKYFETLPTAWANCYTFQKAIEANKPSDVEEWLVLMCLHSTGTLQTVVYDRYDLENFYDPDLWPALERTFPHSDKEKLENIILLTTNNGAIIGSYYPGVIYAPARNRTKWHDDPNLHPYLSGEKLSWQSCLNLQLRDRTMRQKFFNRLLGLQALMSGRIKTTLENFWQADSAFNILDTNAPEALGKTPLTFPNKLA